MHEALVIYSPSQAGRANGQRLPLWFWLPSGLPMAVVALLNAAPAKRAGA